MKLVYYMISSPNIFRQIPRPTPHMGNCRSCDSTSVSTAKLIFLDGAIREFPSPVKVSHVLDQNPTTWFVCDSDELDFDELITAVDAEEELQPGRLYFALPLSWLARPLQGEDMAALAVKASLALAKSGGGGGGEIKCGWCCGRKVDPMVVSGEGYVKLRRTVGGGGGGGGGRGGGLVEERRGRGGGGGRKLAKKLSMILEE